MSIFDSFANSIAGGARTALAGIVPQAPQTDPFMEFITKMLTGGAAKAAGSTAANTGGDFGMLLHAIAHPDPVGEYNRLSGLPSNAPGSMSPFNTGFFRTPAQRAAATFEGAGNVGAPTGAYQAPMPYAGTATYDPKSAAGQQSAALLALLTDQAKKNKIPGY